MDVSQEQQALEPPCMFQFPVTFEDVAVYFSREEWECLSLRQRALYRNVMLDNFRSLAAVGFCGRRPDLVSRLEQWDELWVEDCERADLREAQSGPCPGAGKLADHRRCCLQLSWAHEKVHLQGRVPDTLSTGHMQFPSAASGQKADEPVDLQAAVCGESHRQQPGLEEQCKGSTGAQVFICGTCGKVLSCHSRLAAHQMVHSGARSFTCLECGQTFRWVSNLLRHQRNHTSEKPFRCELCGQSFSLKDRLVQHRKVHTGHRPYECGACGKAFKQKSNLLRHQLVHTGERPFHCAVCSKDFRTKENLSHHQRIHSGEKPYTCSECGKAFRWPKGFSIHQRLHLTKRVYKCERCGKGFRHLGFFTRHQRTHGRGEV